MPARSGEFNLMGQKAAEKRERERDFGPFCLAVNV